RRLPRSPARSGREHRGRWPSPASSPVRGSVAAIQHAAKIVVGMPRFTDNAKVEYDFYDFSISTRDLTLPGTIFGVPEVVPGINVKETISTVKFGINYRFGAY